MLNELEKVAYITGDFLTSLGHRAARLYIEDRVPMNTSIYKMAQEHGLNDEQIKRVCEKANPEVDGALFSAFQKVSAHKTADEKLFYPRFPAAESKVILAALRRVDKQASVSIHLDDYDKALPDFLLTGYNPGLEELFAKEAAQKDETPPRLGVALEKLEFLREEIVLNKTAAEMKLDDCAHSCYQHIKQQVLRGSDIKHIYKSTLGKYSKEEDRNRVKDLFQFAGQKLVDEGVVITKDRQGMKLAYAPLTKEERKEMLTDLFDTPVGAGVVQVLNGSYVNDEHPLYSSIDITIPQYDEADRYDKALTVIDYKIKSIKRKILGESVGGA